LNNGTEFDNSRVRGETLQFELGSGRMITGFNDAVIGMAPGETKTINLAAEEAYGLHNPDATENVPRQMFGPEFEFIKGGTVRGNGPHGVFYAKIMDFDEENVNLDLNHPLAGKDLTFEIELVSVDGAHPIASDESYGWDLSMKKAELYEIAKAKGLSINTKSTKAQIIEALEA
jgi:peptidylprolyl isomerase